MKKRGKRGQIWIETVIYTLIAFALIATVIGFARPKIQEIQDKAILDQSSQILREIKSEISAIRGTSGNIRIVEVTIEKGFFEINSEEDFISFTMESGSEYSEAGVEIEQNDLKILTEKKNRLNEVILTSDYRDLYNLTYEGGENGKILSKSPTPYKISIENKGSLDGKVWIDLQLK
jgi:type II secretory pathway pseudopilin PulG